MSYRRILGNNVFICIVALIFLAIGVMASVCNKNFQWLSRFGALVICTGVIALARPNIVGRPILVEILTEHGVSNDPLTYIRAGKSIPADVVEDVKSQFAVGIIGPILCLLGTTVNGFGDLLNKAFA